MPTNTLNEAKCRAVKPSDRPQKVFDGGGLFLYVAPSGTKTWRVAYRLDGKPQQKSLGPYPCVTLAEARRGRDEIKAALRGGDDPMADKKAKHGITLSQAAESYWSGRKDVSDAYRGNAERGIEMHLVPTLGNVPIGAIDRDMLLAELQRMDAKGLHVYVRRVRMWVGQVFAWAVENGHAKVNPVATIDPEKAFGKSPVESFAALDLRDVPAFIQRLSVERELQSVIACRLLAYTWVRTNELRMMLWGEIDGDTWIIPAGKMKRRKEHVVPLSKQAVALIGEMRARSSGSAYVFPCDRRNDRPMSENAVLYLLHRMGYKGLMTGHGFRSVGSTWANDRGYSPDAIERQLAHVPENKIRSIYNRSAYITERRTILQDWADWLDSCEIDAGVAQG